MDKTKKKQIKRIIGLVCVAVLVILLAVMPLLASSNDEAGGPAASILSGTAEVGAIYTGINGGGTLTEEDVTEITIPQGVMLTEFLVSNGDTVAEGDALAAVDRVSVMSTITQVQETLEYLTKEMTDVRDEEISSSIVAEAGGRVKIIYAEVGDRVQDVMLEHGALAVLSLDGRMAVQLQSGADISSGESVCVTFEDGLEVDGIVESSLDGTVVVTIEDEGYAPGAKVLVTTDERRLGTGELYIHNEWKAVGYSGTISAVSVTEESTVSSGKTLMKLTDTEFSAQFQALSQRHREYEELMLELFRMYQSTEIYAVSDGVVSGVDENSAYLLSDSGGGWFVELLSNAPNGDDEQMYTNYLAQVTLVGDSGWELLVNPTAVEITDYKLLAGVSVETAFMTQAAVYTCTVPVYELVEDQWRQIDASTVSAGDILMFAGDAEGNFVWVVRIEAADQEEAPETGDTADQEESVGNDGSDTSAEPETPGESSGAEGGNAAGMPGQTGGSSGGGYPGMGSAVTEEDSFELYSLEGNTIMSVTAQDTVTISITVDERDILKISAGQSAEVKLDALKNDTFTAVVTEVGTSAESSEGSSKFTVELTMDRDERMIAGMNATVTILLDRVESVLMIPVAALNERGREVYVYTSYDERHEELGGIVVVETGISDGENVQILSGLEEGQVYYYAYYDTLEISNAAESSSSGLFR